jgi:large subunit ribosomal protein L19
MSNLLDEVKSEQLKKDIPVFKAGDTLRVHVRIREGAKERIQVFEGICIGRHNDRINSTFTVRKISSGVGVERVFPLHSPIIDKIEVKKIGRVRRAKLYYLRKLKGKAARVREIKDFQKKKE